MPAPARAGRRLFFALWPSDEFRSDVEAATHSIAQASRGRLIPPRNFHVTLLFLGDVSPVDFEAVQRAGAQLAGSPGFELVFDGIETLGRSVLCLTTSAPPAAAIALAEQLRGSLPPYMQRPDARGFHPHITLARDLPRGQRRQPIQSLRMKVNDFVLVESVRDAGGSHYSVLTRWPLPA